MGTEGLVQKTAEIAPPEWKIFTAIGGAAIISTHYEEGASGQNQYAQSD